MQTAIMTMLSHAARHRHLGRNERTDLHVAVDAVSCDQDEVVKAVEVEINHLQRQ